jgi:hypothetical protein
MPERNPPLTVKLKTSIEPVTMLNPSYKLLDVLTFAGVIRPNLNLEATQIVEIKIFAPKHVTNYNVWAEGVARYAKRHGYNVEVERA